jgi:uncharacterized protein YqcC (DUF446 family)
MVRPDLRYLSGMSKQPDTRIVAAKLAEIESEMKRMGLWQSEPLRPEQYEFRQAFAMDTMAFSQWLQFIFVPRVRGIIAAGGQFPSKSQVGAQAVREFDTLPEADKLMSLLSEFDALFG